MAQRMRRVNELMREVIGSAITTELEDPRIGFVTVTSVDTSPDLRSAKVYVSVLSSTHPGCEGAVDLTLEYRSLPKGCFPSVGSELGPGE